MKPQVDRLVYASRSLVSGPIYGAMEAIRSSALRNNIPEGIYTALLHQGGWFLQWKEGPPGAVERLMQRVATDPRHGALRVVHKSTGPRLLPEAWSMGIVQGGDTSEAFGRRLAQMETERKAGFQYSPPAVWRRLSTPMDHPGAGLQHDTEAFQRLMVCAAHGTDSFDLVQWLARERGGSLVRRRFAGANPPDVATDFVDFVEGGRHLRVVAMARNGMMLGITRAFLPDFSHMALLFSGDAARDLELFNRALRACEGAPQYPVIVSLGLPADANQAMFAKARQQGFIFLDAGPVPMDDKAAIWATLNEVLEQHQVSVISRWPVASA